MAGLSYIQVLMDGFTLVSLKDVFVGFLLNTGRPNLPHVGIE
jgi:hypothetical protein